MFSKLALLKRTLLIGALGFAVLIFLGTLVFLYKKSNADPVVYQTEKPVYTTIVKKTVATGNILPRKEVAIKPQVSGVIDHIYVEAGQHVNKGDLLARISIIPNMERLNSAEAQLETARINYRNAERELGRQQQLLEQKLISDFEYNKFQLDFELQKENVSAAENNVALIKEGASKKAGKVSNLVAATTPGMVLDVPVKEGAFVIETNTFNEGTTIAIIADMADMIFKGNVDEAEVGKIREGMELLLNIGALQQDSYVAVLEYISPKGVDDEGTIKFEIRAAVKLRKDQFLRAGYSANADIVLDRRDNVLAVNEANLIVDGDRTLVEVETSPQVFEKREIKTGLSDGIMIEIVSGLKAEESVKKL